MENVKKFYALAEKDEGLKTELINVNEKIRSKQSDFDGIRKLIEDEILPLAKKKDLGFTVDELLSFANEQYTELSEEELLEVSGGLSARNAAIGLSTVLLLSLGGTSATNFLSHNNDLSQSISMSAPAERQENQIQENEKQINEENDSVVYQNELDTKESEERNTQDKAAEEVNAKIQQNEESEPTKQTENNNANINAKEAETQDGKVNDIEEAVAQGEDAIFRRLQERFDKGRFDYAEDEEGLIFGGLQDKFDEERRGYEEDTDQVDIEGIEGGNVADTEGNIAHGEDSILGNIVDMEEMQAKGGEDATSANVANGEGIADQAEGDTKADKENEERREEAKAPEDVETENVKDVTNEQIPPFYEMNSTDSFRATMVADIANYLRTVDGKIENVPKEAREGLLKNVEFVRSYIRWHNGIWTIRQGDVEHKINSEDAEIIIDFDDDYNSAPTIGDGSTVSNAVEENGPQVSEETHGNEETGVETDEVQGEDKGTEESEVGKAEAPEGTPVYQEPETAERESNGEQEGANTEGDQEESEDKQSAEKETDAAVDNQEASEEAKVVDKKAETKEESVGKPEDVSPEDRQEDSTLKEKEPEVAPTVSKETHSGEKEGAKTGGQEDRTGDVKGSTTEAEVGTAVPTGGDKAEARGQEDGTEQAEDKAEVAVQDVKTDEKSSYEGQSLVQKTKKSREILVIELAEYLRSIEGNLDNVQKSDQNRLKKDVKEASGWLTEKNSKEGTLVYEVEKSTLGKLGQWITAQPKSIISKADGTIIKDFARKYGLESYDSKGHVEGTSETNTEKQEDAESKSIQIEISGITDATEASTVKTAEAGVQGDIATAVDAEVQGENAGTAEAGVQGGNAGTAEAAVEAVTPTVKTAEAGVQGDIATAVDAEVQGENAGTVEAGVQGGNAGTAEAAVEAVNPTVKTAEAAVQGAGVGTADASVQGENTAAVDAEVQGGNAGTAEAGVEAVNPTVKTAEAGVQGDIVTSVEAGIQGSNAGTAEAAVEAVTPTVEKKDSKEDQEIGADHEMASEERESEDAEDGQEEFGDGEADRLENSDASSEAEGTESSFVRVSAAEDADAEDGQEASEAAQRAEERTDTAEGDQETSEGKQKAEGETDVSADNQEAPKESEVAEKAIPGEKSSEEREGTPSDARDSEVKAAVIGQEALEEPRNVDEETEEEGAMLGGMQDVFDEVRFDDEEDKEEDSMAQRAEAVEAEVPTVEEKDSKEDQEIGADHERASEEREGADAEGDKERFGDGEADRLKNSEASSKTEGTESSLVSVTAAEGDQEASGATQRAEERTDAAEGGQEASEGKQKAEGETDVSADNQEASKESEVDEKAVTEGESADEQRDALPESKQEAEVNEIHYEAPPRFLTAEMVKYVANYLRGVKGNIAKVPEEDREKLQEDVEFLVKHFKSNRTVAFGIRDINGNIVEISGIDRLAIFEFKVAGRWNNPQVYGEYDATTASKDERDVQEANRSAKIPYKVREQGNSSMPWYDQEREIPIRIEAVRDYLEFINGDMERVENSDRGDLLSEIADIFKYLKYNETNKRWQVLAPGRNNGFDPIELKEDEITSIRNFYEKYNKGQGAPEGAKVEEKAASEGESAGEQRSTLSESKQEAEVNEIHYDPPPRFLTGEMVKYVANYLRGVKGNRENVPEEDKEKLQEDVEFLVKHFPSSQYTAEKYRVHGINSESFEISETDFEAIFEFKVRGKWTDPQKYGEYDGDIAKKEKDAQESYRGLKIHYKAPEWSESAQRNPNWKRTMTAITDRVKAVEECLEFTSGNIEHVEDSDRETLRAEVADLVKDMEYNEKAKCWKIRDTLFGTDITDNQARIIRTFHEKYNK